MTEIPVVYLGNRQWRLVMEVTYIDPILGRLVVPAGTETDFSTIPRILWPWIAPEDNSILAPALHDYAYATDGRVWGITRRDADDLFYRAMITEGVPRHRAYICWLAVRVFGRFLRTF